MASARSGRVTARTREVREPTNEWQPIEYAPHDRYLLLARINESNQVERVDVGRWKPTAASAWHGSTIYGWVTKNDSVLMTHYAALPKLAAS